MAIAVASKTEVTSDISSPLRFTAPSGIQVGDLLFCYINSLVDNYATDITKPTGWTLLYGENNAGTSECYAIYYKIAVTADVTEPYYDFTITDTCSGVMLRITGADTTALSNYTHQQSNSSGVFTTADITPAAANSLFIFCVVNQSSSQPTTFAMATDNPTWTQQLTGAALSSPYNFGAVATALRASTNPTGDFSTTANLYNFGFFMALKPAITNVTALPAVLASTISIPAIALSLEMKIAAGIQSMVASLQARTISLGAGVSPNPLAALFSLPAITVLTPDALAQPSVLAGIFSIPTPQINLDMVVARNVLTALLSTQGVTATGQAVATPSGLVLTFSLPAIEVDLDMVVAVAVKVITASIPTITVIPETRVIAGELVLTFAIQASTITTDSVMSIDPVEMYLSINSPFVKSTQYGRKYSVQGDAYGVKYI